MNLALDFGNTRIKAGLFREGELLNFFSFNSEDEMLAGIVKLEGIRKCIIGAVTGNYKNALEKLSRQYHCLLFSPETKTPLKNLYQSALSLGSDRLSAAVGAYTLFPGRNVLGIDAGTCIKYNFVNDRNEYLGGAISPGIVMRLNAMHHYTHALPDVSPEAEYSSLLGRNTRESLLSGAIVGAVCETDEMINRYKLLHQGLQVVLSGGDAGYLSGQLKNPFFAHQNLVLTGLNAILNYNLEEQDKNI